MEVQVLSSALVIKSDGRLAQLVERFIYTEDVGGPSPSSSTTANVYILHVRQSDPVYTGYVGSALLPHRPQMTPEPPRITPNAIYVY